MRMGRFKENVYSPRLTVLKLLCMYCFVQSSKVLMWVTEPRRSSEAPGDSYRSTPCLLKSPYLRASFSKP